MFGAQQVQLFFILLNGAVCFLIFLFSCIIKSPSAMRKKATLLIELSSALLLIADFFAYAYEGDLSNTAYWMVRVCDFLVFALVYVEILGLSLYISTYFEEGGTPRKRNLMVINILSGLGFFYIIVSQFTGTVYYIDSNNCYQRGDGFLFAFIAPLAIYMLILWIILENRKSFPKLILIALLIFATAPAIGAILQSQFYGAELLNMSFGICTMLLFVFSLTDQNRYLIQMAEHERMTGLPNAHGFMQEINRKIATHTLMEYNALYFDIVRMGLVNRRYGSSVGDMVIREYVNTLQAALRSDEVLGRLGGNYFVALVHKEHTDDFLEKLERTNVSVIMPSRRTQLTVPVTAVAGIYEIERNNIWPDQIMNNIIMAANIAKNVKHKPYLYLTPELIKEMNDLKALQEMIPTAMDQKEFKPFYQPKVDARDRKLCGAEALVRWEHEGEVIPPQNFVPILEQDESICRFDFYMLDYVCSDLHDWLQKGLNPPTISVNFSRKNLGNAMLADEIFDVVRKYDVAPNLIQIEITETLDEYPLEDLKRVVEALESYGISTAIDDFGTGSSSINLIKEVPFDVLKIDKSFIDTVSEKDRKILGHIIAMAQEVGASVITEGVENEEQLNVLMGLDCTKIQGYYFDKPLPKEEFELRITNPLYQIAN